MAGHSKWSNIQHRKKAQDAKRGKHFTKFIREIVVATKEGGADKTSNPRLRLAIDKALQGNMTKDTINKAIQRGAGQQDSDQYQSITYEGYAAGGIAVLVKCLSDNRNRTVGEVRHAFSKHGGNLGTEGSVAFLFKEKGLIVIKTSKDFDTVFDLAIELGAEDLIKEEDVYIIETSPQQFESIFAQIQTQSFEILSADITMIADDYLTCSEEEAIKVKKLLDMLEDLDDVQSVYINTKV